MNENNYDEIEFKLTPYTEDSPYDLDAILFRLNSQIDLLSSHADSMDYIISIASGIVSNMLDIFWCDDLDLARGREIASQDIEKFVKKVARISGCRNSDDLKESVRYLENNFHLASDGNISDFGGGLQHHLRDFAHHPTIVGLFFSILTQFTGCSYGTGTDGAFQAVDISASSKAFIGDSVPQKITNGTVVWFFHLVSDMAGSSSTAGLPGGIGIPGPILSLAKEVSAVPFFENMNGESNSMSVFLSKMFNGTIFAEYGEDGKIIKDSIVKFDLRGELGFGIELGRQALPVIANECVVRCFYFIRHLAMEMGDKKVRSIDDLKSIDWKTALPGSNPTLAKMLTISTGVFTTLDISEAIAAQKYWVGVNYIGLGRFAVAIGEDVCWFLKKRNLKQLREMYEEIDRNTYRKTENNIYRKIENDLADVVDGFGLTEDETEILYNIEYYKTQHDIEVGKSLSNDYKVRIFKKAWVIEWQKSMEENFSGFLQIEGAQLHWYSFEELMDRIDGLDPQRPWYRLVLFEAMLFEPYYALGLEKDKDGKYIPSKKYDILKNPTNDYRKGSCDQYLDQMFAEKYFGVGFISRLRKSYDKNNRELKETLKNVFKIISVSAVISAATAATGGAFAPAIATALVGSHFAGLSGAALTNACLAYFGGGAIAAGGAGMAGGTLAIAGGGAALSFGASGSISSVAENVEKTREESIISQSAKLLVTVKEIFLDDENNFEFAKRIYDRYREIILKIEHEIVDLKFDRDVKKGKEKKELSAKIKDLKETADAMRVARKMMSKYSSEFEVETA